jgi:hypothetical protein
MIVNNSREYVRMLLLLHKNSKEPINKRQALIWEKFEGMSQEFDSLNLKKSKKYARAFRTRIKECFSNSMRIAIADGSLKYYEGYATHIIPTSHAWIVDGKGEVIDPTYCLLGDPNPTVDYFGMHIPVDQVKPRSYEPAWLYLVEKELESEET